MEMWTPEAELHIRMMEHVIWEGGDDGDMEVPLGIDDTTTPEEMTDNRGQRGTYERDDSWDGRHVAVETPETRKAFAEASAELDKIYHKWLEMTEQ